MHFDKLSLLSSHHSVLSSTNKFSPNVCSSGEWNSSLQECEGWLFYLSGNLGHILLFFKCLISPLPTRMVCDCSESWWYIQCFTFQENQTNSVPCLKFPSVSSSLPRPSLESPARPWMVLACQPADFTAVSPASSSCLFGLQPHLRVKSGPVPLPTCSPSSGPFFREVFPDT